MFAGVLSRIAGRLRQGLPQLIAAAGVVALGWAWFAVPGWAALLGWGAMALVLAVLPEQAQATARMSPPEIRSDSEISADAQAVLSALPYPAFLLGRDGVVRFANRQAGQRHAATRVGDPFTATFRSPEVRDALESESDGSAVEVREPGRSGRVSTLSVNTVGSGSLLLITVQDVSERLAIARMRTDFVANASHELRTPLSSITGFIETLLGPARNDPVASERFLRVMQDQAGRMRRLIDDLLSLSRAEMREHRPPTDTVDVSLLLREVAEGMASTAADHGVTLSMRVPQEPVLVVGDRDELFQVFSNLIENGIKYGAAGAKVDVEAEPRHDLPSPALAVSIRDYGPGIAPEHLPRLTERFYRVDVGASRDLKGTGLGLAIVKHILSRHRGRLEIESTPGQGARFTALLPITPTNSPAETNRLVSSEL